MQINYLEIVTRDVDAVCAAYAAGNGLQFGDPDAGPLEIPGHGRFAIYLHGGIQDGLWQQ